MTAVAKSKRKVKRHAQPPNIFLCFEPHCQLQSSLRVHHTPSAVSPVDKEAANPTISELIDYCTAPLQDLYWHGECWNLRRRPALPQYFTEYARRPSVLRKNSTADTIVHDPRPRTILADIHLNFSAATVTSMRVLTPAIHHRVRVVQAIESEAHHSRERGHRRDGRAKRWSSYSKEVVLWRNVV